MMNTSCVNLDFQSNNKRAIFTVNNCCLRSFSKARFFIIFISSSVNLAYFNISEFVNDSKGKNNCSCLTFSNIVEK